MGKLRFLKRVKEVDNPEKCSGCVFDIIDEDGDEVCWLVDFGIDFEVMCGNYIFVEVPKPPLGTKCRRLKDGIVYTYTSFV